MNAERAKIDQYRNMGGCNAETDTSHDVIIALEMMLPYLTGVAGQMVQVVDRVTLDALECAV